MTGAVTHDNTSMDSIHGDDGMGWELFGRGAVRKGKYKLVHIENAVGGRGSNDRDGSQDGWQLYDLSQDPGEIDDIAEKYPDIVKELLQVWDQYRAETGVVWGTPIRFVGEEWDGNSEEGIIGGDAITQTTAWMKVRKNEAPPSRA
jgi:arylsulfatase